MDRDELAAAASPQALVAHVRGQARPPGGHGHGGHGHGTTSVREVSYEGHDIVIRTTYEIEVDGRSLHGHMGVTNDGQVHYHAVPNLSFASAVDLVKQLIDTFPDDFAGGHR
jgi:hypothetical protein